MHTFSKILVAAVLFSAYCGCNSESSEHAKPETNVVKDYVNVPKEKALDAKAQVESAHGAALEQLDETELEEEGAETEE